MSLTSCRDPHNRITVTFRVDASLQIGSGHVMRCLTLAEALRKYGADCSFICREHAGNLINQICERGFVVTGLKAGNREFQTGIQDHKLLPAHATWLGTDWQSDAEATRDILNKEPPDWLIVDHYALNCIWEQALRPHCGQIMVIDDLADRLHDCDLLLDQNLGRKASDYSGLISPYCTMLVGPEYALLRPEFALLREFSLKRRQHPQIRTVLITMGGMDLHDATSQVLQSLKSCPLVPDCRIIVVMGAHAPWLERVKALAEQMPWPCEVKVDSRNMAQLMADSDLAIGAAGSTSWERCALGLPSIAIVLAENQRAVSIALRNAGASYVIDGIKSVSKMLPSTVSSIHDDVLRRMSEKASQVCDGNGASRVVTRIATNNIAVRHVSEADLAALLIWRNHPDTRRFMYSKHEITESEHRAWYVKAMQDTGRHLLIVEENSLPLGFVQFKQLEELPIAEWGFYVVPDSPPGTGTKLGMAALTYAFEQLGYNKIIGEVTDYNERSVLFHKKMGFEDAGFVSRNCNNDISADKVRRFEITKSKWIS